jgi:hypothetical protein
MLENNSLVLHLKLIPTTMNIYNINSRIFFEILSQFGNKDIQTSANKVAVVVPNRFQYKLSF